jgi:hypothetical protein
MMDFFLVLVVGLTGFIAGAAISEEFTEKEFVADCLQAGVTRINNDVFVCKHIDQFPQPAIKEKQEWQHKS